LRKAERDREEKLLYQLEEMKTAELREEKIRQSIRENSVELRSLQQKLNLAYMNAERCKQVKEKEANRAALAAAETAYASAVSKQQALADQAEAEAEEKHWLQSREYKATLQAQLADREKRKTEEVAQFLKEKQLVDELVAQIRAEDAAEQRRRYEAQKEARIFIEQYLSERQQWIAKEREKVEEENRAIELYNSQQYKREAEQKAEHDAQEEVRAKIYENLAKGMQAREAERAEIEDLRIELAQAEQAERLAARERLDMERRIRLKLEMIDAYKFQIAQKRALREKEREEEEIFRSRLLSKMEEDSRLEQLSREAKRRKQMDHKKAVDAMVVERRRRLEEEHVQEEEDRRKERELEAFKQHVIEQERQRLLREHASKLAGHLPKGVFKDETDLDLFDEEFKQKLKVINK
jgi:hypothetical protein